MREARSSGAKSVKSCVRCSIIGLAREGTALARFLAERGASVTVSDLKSEEELQENIEKLKDLPIRCVLGGHPSEILDGADTLFLSPGVPLEAPIVLEAKRRGIPISSETKLFTELCPAPVIGITGSSGKTTTVSLVGRMLKACFRTWVGGNIGRPLIGHLEDIEPADKVVMELSSFQLEIMEWSPAIAAILNITPNHLDRHPSMEAYTEAKLNILRFQKPGDVAVLGYELQSSKLKAQSSKLKARVVNFSLNEEVEQGAFLRDGEIALRLGDTEQRICSADEIELLGRHNLGNVLAACAIAGVAGASRQAMAEAATTFQGVEHRLELVREMGEAPAVRYYNDSIATTPERTVAALRSFDQPIVLLAGGRDKHLPWDEMARLTLQKARCLILFGEAAPIIERAVQDARSKKQDAGCTMHKRVTLEEAVEAAVREARPGDVVLLSPGGTSFDAFRDFAERGERFRELVEAL